MNHIAVVEAALRQGFVPLWTSGHTTFVAVMTRLVLFGRSSKSSLMRTQDIPDSAFITRAIDVLSVMGRRFSSIACLRNAFHRFPHQVRESHSQVCHLPRVKVVSTDLL